MSKSYSLDLRQKVMCFITQGGGKRAASKLFGIGEDTIYRWLRLLKEGDLSPKKGKRREPKIPYSVLEAYVKDHPDHTLEEIGLAVGLSISKVHKHLNILKITRKKKPYGIKKVAMLNDRSL